MTTQLMSARYSADSPGIQARLGKKPKKQRGRAVNIARKEDQMKRVTGIGGIFFSAKDPKALCAWYKTHLGIDVQD